MLLFIAVEDDVQKQPFADVLENRCSKKFCNIHRKTPALEQLYKRDSSSGFSYEYYKIFKNNVFYRELSVAVSEHFYHLLIFSFYYVYQ